MFEVLKCPNCGAPVEEENPKFCSHCGVGLKSKTTDSENKKGFSININTGNETKQFSVFGGDNNSPQKTSRGKSRRDAILLAVISLFIGGIALHQLYLNRIGRLVLSVLFIWTTIPFFIGIYDAVKLYGMTDAEFVKTYS